ncbi:hypothetical protein LY39_03661 [Roseinatronobacter bogoriensis subsp. barguzinensis]|uniref:Uncharacterized protein n=1 Tax=Roseinatronobacter bogoriensis subsp. barguzinensis TaxID=441209 RepID=A0A2K8KBL6_9RHOB|nr:hypothetical protein BG454_05245 [Rhodobaca barguzinensis]MBB4209894.1 hypothetical protein [Rhodobaca bogoriensis DSM 18756]TDW33010.1 hypothetical protein LY39_03661 [Rhodobaca barguzinensis]TDY65847.1 hypothetical protein EV660_1161 [Rhodobaca bogoriensis DSM 18756]
MQPDSGYAAQRLNDGFELQQQARLLAARGRMRPLFQGARVGQRAGKVSKDMASFQSSKPAMPSALQTEKHSMGRYS